MLLHLPAPKPPAPDVAPFEYRFHLPRDARAVRVARTALRTALHAHDLPEFVGRAELLAGELVTNAFVHTTGDAELTLWWSQWRVLRLSVRDHSPYRPTLARPHHSTDESGRGLRLLALLSDRWGCTRVVRDLYGGETKSVWCELTRQAPPAWAEWDSTAPTTSV
ncbi:hypothetical protein GCM10010218_27410 [Streptomyces mashuensis]|uniref:Histidine kinase/HSP90-like ATPase domain-containing protein n=1 Tax=Streptomyces mashuensis TaxID=33904 RepID=A0A919B2N6_9ACTN|nr:ATP-binding protein [Streptomyces mashuensis]GHF44538.1 hypothetical protein GCM10010218_27410 [Streptomyces mashuensis]